MITNQLGMCKFPYMKLGVADFAQSKFKTEVKKAQKMLKLLRIILLSSGLLYIPQSIAEITCRGQFGRSAQESIHAKSVDTLNAIANLDEDLRCRW